MIIYLPYFVYIANVPQLFYIGTDQSIPNYEFHVMVMELLGKSLEDLFEACGH